MKCSSTSLPVPLYALTLGLLATARYVYIPHPETPSLVPIASGDHGQSTVPNHPAVPQIEPKDESNGCSKSWPGWSGIKYLFAFGDSYTHTGFNPQGPQPDYANPLGNPPYPGFTSSAGPNWLDFLTTKYNASLLLAYNMADGGSTMDSTLVQPYRPDAMSTRDQVGKKWAGIYSKKGKESKEKEQDEKDCHWTPENTLFTFFIGINDVGKTYMDTNRTIIKQLFTEYTRLVEEVYNSGGRNFLFMNIPPMQRSPLTFMRGPEAIALEEDAIENWNHDLSVMSRSIPKLLPDSTSFVFDTYGLFSRIMDKPDSLPQTSGLKDTSGFCQAYTTYFGGLLPDEIQKGCKWSYNQYFWINDLHPTYPIHNATAAEISRMLASQPSNLGIMCGPGNRNGQSADNSTAAKGQPGAPMQPSGRSRDLRARSLRGRVTDEKVKVL